MVMPDGCSRRARGVRVTRVPSLALWLTLHGSPVLTIEHTVLSIVADAQADPRAVEAILRACRLRLTTPDRLLAVAATRPRLRRRGLLVQVCAEVREGVTSELEKRIAAGSRCRMACPRVGCRPPRTRDLGGGVPRCAVRGQGVIVELDGRLGHEQESEVLRDQERDNHATLTGQATLRFGGSGSWATPAWSPARWASCCGCVGGRARSAPAARRAPRGAPWHPVRQPDRGAGPWTAGHER